MLSVFLLAAGYLKAEPRAGSAKVFALMAVFIISYLLNGMAGQHIDPQFQLDLSSWQLIIQIGMDAIPGLFMIYCFLIFQEQQNFEEGEADHGPMDLDYALGFQISCGAFSFAEMGRSGPGFTYECILGVSGTLKCLGDYEKRIIRDTYQIAKLSVAPSIYGENRMQWDASRDVVVLADEERFYQEISLEVSKKQKRVACLVFFENEARMKSYATYLTSNNIQATNQARQRRP